MTVRIETALRAAFARACVGQFGSIYNMVRRHLHTKSGTKVRYKLWSVERGRG